jgi:Activator of Hsp90 ATPase homolog 1-like protein
VAAEYRSPTNTLRIHRAARPPRTPTPSKEKFVELVPSAKIVEVVEFESQDPAFRGEMRLTVTLADVDEGTEVAMFFENIPEGIRLEDNEQARDPLSRTWRPCSRHGQNRNGYPAQGLGLDKSQILYQLRLH